MAGVASSSRQRSKVAPYLMILPALAYLAVFFVVPFCSLFRTSLSTMGGSIYLPKLTFAWDFSNYWQALTLYQDQIMRSLLYALAATVVSLLISYPLAYVIAFKSGRYKNLLLGLVVLPFFVTFLVRTLAWKTIFADDGIVVRTLDAVGLVDGRLLSTPVGGDRRIDLQLDDIHDPAALRQPGEDRSAAAGGVQGPVFVGVPRVQQGHSSAVAARRDRRQHAGVHSGRR